MCYFIYYNNLLQVKQQIIKSIKFVLEKRPAGLFIRPTKGNISFIGDEFSPMWTTYREVMQKNQVYNHYQQNSYISLSIQI